MKSRDETMIRPGPIRFCRRERTSGSPWGVKCIHPPIGPTHTQRQVVAAQMSWSAPVKWERGAYDHRSTFAPFFHDFGRWLRDVIHRYAQRFRIERWIYGSYLSVRSAPCGTSDDILGPRIFPLRTRCGPMIDRSRGVP